MTKKYFKLLLSLGVILCILCTSLTMSMAAPSWEDYLGPIEGTTTEATEENTTAEETPETEATTKAQVTQKPTRPATTQNQAKPSPTINVTVEDTNEKPTKEKTEKTTKEKTTKDESKTETSETNTETTDPDEALLKDGQFFVYLERNNGERRLKTILDKPGLVNQPNMPIRKGYIFKGWYADPEFKTPWDFGKSIAQKGTVIYAKWESDGSTVTYGIKVQKVPGGTIEVNPGTASEGEVVIITVKPDAGKRLVAGSVTVNGKHSNVLSFIMPKGEVVVSASFEDVPETIEEEKPNSLVFVGIGAALFVIILIVVIIIIKIKTRPAVVEYDENGAIILDDDDDGWIDESIVVEDGFANGKIIRESADFEDNYEPISLDAFETDTSDLFEIESFDE